MTKDDLKKLSQQTFFDNNEGLISPDGHRKYNEAIIDNMATGDDLQPLANPNTPKHAQPTAVDEVLGCEWASWCRSHNHVAHIPLWGVDARFPIGEVLTHYSTEKGQTVNKRTTFGPAVKTVNNECYFMVFQAGDYQLLQKKYQNQMMMTSISVSEAQAANGFRINFDDGVTSSTKLNGSFNDLRTYARLYLTSRANYQDMNYILYRGVTFKYSSDLTKPYAIAGGDFVGMALHAIKARGPLITRQGRIVSIRSVVRPELKLRPTFCIKKDVPVEIGLFIEPLTGYNGQDYEVWYKKSKSWYYIYENMRRVHRIVGYIKVYNQTAEQMMATGLKSSLTPEPPQYIDFQIRMKNAEKTVVAQYRATKEVHLDMNGNPVEYGVVFRRR